MLLFALVIAVGSHYFLPLFFVYATLLSLASQCAESAAPLHCHPVHPRHDAFMVPVSPLRRVWDPGGTLTLSVSSKPTMPPSIVSPLGTPLSIRSTACRVNVVNVNTTKNGPTMSPLVEHAPVGSMSPTETPAQLRRTMASVLYFALTFPAHDVDRMSPLRRQWDPGIAKDGIDRSFHPGIASSVSVFHGVHPVLSDGQDDASNECRGALALIQSLFQYSHPILSRPTVPNIR